MTRRNPPVTKEDLRQYQDELVELFGIANVAYANVSHSQFSLAKYYGGLKINGSSFVYNSDDDLLVREDVAKWINKQKKAQ